MNRQRYLTLLGSAALLALAACGTDESTSSTTSSPSAKVTVTVAAPTPSPSVTPTPPPPPAPAPPPTPTVMGEGGENDLGPGYVDTSFVYPATLVNASTIPPAQLGDYVHFELYVDATSTAPGPNAVPHHVCVASFDGFHDCATVNVGDTMVPMDIYVHPGFNLHFGVSDSAAPMAGAFYYFGDFPKQPAFTAGTDWWIEVIVKFDATQNGFGIYLPTLHIKD